MCIRDSPKSYALFVNPAFNVHPFVWNKERNKRAKEIIAILKENLTQSNQEKIDAICMMVEDLKVKEINTVNRIMKGSPTREESFDHNLIDAMLLSVRLAHRI